MASVLVMLMIGILSQACGCYDVTAAGGVHAFTGESAANYDMLRPQGRRKAPSSVTMTEDRHLSGTARRQAIGGMRDLRRNSSILQWMVSQHLNWVVSATFQSTTGDEGFDAEAEAMMREESRADRFEFRRMLDFETVARLAESHAVIDGDCGILFLDDGCVQGIEGDRVKDPVGAAENVGDKNEWYNGVRVRGGVPISYALHERTNGYSSLKFERTVPVENMHLHGYYDWRFDQYRGVSPVVTAYNQLVDIYQAESLWLVKNKIAGLLGMKVKRGVGEPIGTVTGTQNYDENGNPTRKTYATDFGAGPWMWDMDPGDDIDMITFDGPGGNTQEFWHFCTAVAMAALDLPYSMWDSSKGNFFGNKTSWLAYSRACDVKRARCCAMRDKITAFKYRQAIRAKRIKLPRVNGAVLTVENRPWQWIPRLMPWWRPLEEVTAALSAIGGGLSNPYHVCMESDQADFEENIRLIEKAMKYATEHGVPLSFVVGDELAKSAQDASDKRKAAEKEAEKST